MGEKKSRAGRASCTDEGTKSRRQSITTGPPPNNTLDRRSQEDASDSQEHSTTQAVLSPDPSRAVEALNTHAAEDRSLLEQLKDLAGSLSKSARDFLVPPKPKSAPVPPPLEEPRGWFSRVRFAAPFGRYESADEQEPPAHEVMVGREGQRAYFLDLLFNSGKRGAFLVTGRRGSGKTSFVKHCLAEYRREIYQRFLRSNRGRNLFWDRLLLVGLGLTTILIALFLTELLEILGAAARSASDNASSESIRPIPGKLILRLLGLPVILLCAYPWLYGRELFAVALRVSIERPGRRDRSASLLAWLASLLVAAFAFFLGPFGAPALGMSRLLVAITLAVCSASITSYRTPTPTAVPASSDSASPNRKLRIVAFKVLQGFPGFLFASLAVLYLWKGFSGLMALLSQLPWAPASLKSSTMLATQTAFLGDVGIAFCLGGICTAMRGLYIYWQYRKQVSDLAHRTGAIAYSLLALAELAIGCLLLAHTGTMMEVPVLILALAVLTTCHLRFRKAASSRSPVKVLAFVPQRQLLVILKAILATVLAVQLLQPVLTDDNLITLELRHMFDPILAPLHSAAKALYPNQGLTNPSSLLTEPAPQASVARGQGTSVASLFGSQHEEARWVLALFLLGLFIYQTEYEWIVRPFHRQRTDRAHDPQPPGPTEELPDTPDSDRILYHHRALAETTFFWLIHELWNPVLVCSINLGFERLDHRRVVQAMLIDLREKYRSYFVAWNSPIGNISRLIKILLLLVLASMAGRHWFKLPTFEDLSLLQQSQICHDQEFGYRNICHAIRGYQGTGGLASSLCNLDPSSQLLHLAYADLIVPLDEKTRPRYSTNHFLMGLLNYRDRPYPPTGFQVGAIELPERSAPPCVIRTSLLNTGFEIRFFHLGLLALFWITFRFASNHMPILPYIATLKRIDFALEGLFSRRSVTSKATRWRPAQWVRGFFSNEQVEQLDQEPIDPRMTEIAFLNILQDINSSVIRLPGAQHQVVSLPTPELIFFFDELDKLGTRIDPSQAVVDASPQSAEEIDSERRRSLELHKLLADMKSMLSSSMARFIFVGGRNLHDEWLADQTARQPLLTNIFNAEIYLPSLLSDNSRGEEGYLHIRVEQYLKAQKQRAEALYEQTQKALWRPEIAINTLDRQHETFAPPASSNNNPPHRRDLSIDFIEISSARNQADWGSDELLIDLIFFLSWRSLGNAKRLRELLATFVRPASRFVSETAVRWAAFPCQHVLAFRDIDRFRLQFIASVYRHLSLHFEQRLIDRDDKVPTSTFYLADFLFKFHGRAFSWGNLERVDELVHIHRAVDLRNHLEEIVEKWSRWILHPIRNAMYGFRFRSDLAREISYLSRQSPEDMAAFNFTLDESQALKAFYAVRIRRLAPNANLELQELYAALGELYEFDQEFESARIYYRRALTCLDEEYRRVVGDGGLFSTTTPHMDLLTRSNRGMENVRQYMTWAVARLRLTLQIAMSFERARDLERAALEYRNARSLSTALLAAMLDDTGRRLLQEVAGFGSSPPRQGDRLHALKNLNILFQPVFAEAWVAEKYEGGVDTGVALLEVQLEIFRKILPFAREKDNQPAEDAGDNRESNFSLIISELNNKLGDMYFFRGKQAMTTDNFSEMIGQLKESRGPRVGYDGYLQRAYYFYALGLHDLRRYITHRLRSSGKKYGIMMAAKGKGYPMIDTLASLGWPDFVFRAVGGALNDLAESSLARVSLYGLLCERSLYEELVGCQQSPEADVAKDRNSLFLQMARWLEGREKPQAGNEKVELHLAGKKLQAGTLSGWLGQWSPQPGSESLLLDFDEWKGHDDPRRLLVSLHLTLAGAQFLEQGGYLEEAASQLLEVTSTATRFIWWYLLVDRLATWSDHALPKNLTFQTSPLAARKFKALDSMIGSKSSGVLWNHLLKVAVFGLKEADRLLRYDRRADQYLRRRAARYEEGSAKRYLVGPAIPPRALTLACSLGAAACIAAKRLQPDSANTEVRTIQALIDFWTGRPDQKLCKAISSIDDFLQPLKNALIRHPFPMLNRLQGLKALIDANVLRDAGEPPKALEDSHRLIEHILELQQLEAQYASPLHFTPLEMGVTLSLFSLRCRASVTAGWTLAEKELREGLSETLGPEVTKDLDRRRSSWIHDLEEARLEGRRFLIRSEETYTMRRAFYESISHLYYLYDDFNDRQIHFNLAMQMAGSEVSLLLRELIELPEHSTYGAKRAQASKAAAGTSNLADSKPVSDLSSQEFDDEASSPEPPPNEK